MNVELSLLVLRCRDVSRSRVFYEALGLTFRAEQHGTGPQHYSTQLGATVLELYPASSEPTPIRFGLGMGSPGSGASFDEPPNVLTDPDGNRVEVARALARRAAEHPRLVNAVAVYSRNEPPFDVVGAARLLGAAVDNLCADWTHEGIVDADVDIIADSLDQEQRGRVIRLADRLRIRVQSEPE